MAGRRSWNELSPAYRNRLMKAGITPQQHAAGASIKKARGHANTPEHPTEGLANPEKFRNWFDERQSLVNQVNRRKERMFNASHKWSAKRSRKMTQNGAQNNPPSISQLRWALEADESEIMDAISNGDEEFSFLFYH